MAPIQVSAVFLPSLMFHFIRNPSTGPPLPELVSVQKEYDYIVVGSGWGGSVVANRLSQDGVTKVLLLEAGAKDNISTEIPLMSLSQHGGGYDWQFRTTPQKSMCWGNPEKKCTLPSGKVAGGSSTIGELIYMRPSRLRLDDIGKHLPGWSYDEVLPFYKKSEDFHDQNEECVTNDEHRCGGEVYLGPLPKGTRQNTTGYFIEGAKQLLGLYETETSEDEPGIDRVIYFMKNGIRVNAASAFLKPIARGRKNLHISLNSFVNKILIDPITKQVLGVEFEKDNTIYQVKAKKEVVLSAGVFQSPKILMLSGIGPEDHLRQLGIPVIVHLSGVGQNYQDFVWSPIPFGADRNLPKHLQSLISMETLSTWTKGQGGLLANPSGIEGGVTWRSSLADKNSTEPDVCFMFQSLGFHEVFSFFLQRSLGYSNETWETYFEPEVNKDTFNIQVSVKRPRSRGTVQLRSSNPKDHPIIDPNFLNDPEEHDLKVLAEGVRMAMNFDSTAQFRQHGYKQISKTFKECAHIKNYTSYDALKCRLRKAAFPRWCGCCTNKMGSQSDVAAVVDQRLRVYGVHGLRVADASVLPDLLKAGPAATVIMVGEKAAQMILEDNA